MTEAEAALNTETPVRIVVEARAHGWRLDHYLSRLYPNFSRELFKRAIKDGRVIVNGLAEKPAYRLRVNDLLDVRLPEEPDSALRAEDLPIEVVFEDEAIIVVNKAPGMITHPGKGNYRGTLAGALQFHFDQLSDTAGQLRPGIVHRLDKDTSGVLVVAKDNQVHDRLAKQFEERTVEKEYRAIVWGAVEFDTDWIESHIRVHPRNREKMQVCDPGENSREAVTYFEVLHRARGFTYLKLLPRTGRTHQLRVHLAHRKHPIVADRVYGGRAELSTTDVAGPGESQVLFDRQALHAFRLELTHPSTGERMSFSAPLPHDFTQTLAALGYENG